ncbi:glycosyltransferase family 2 protein [Almyronema epifaneia]|uniref:Glycosyltransferase family 2 protein n=1 Tax=Almyronema epifaneia S1 TaxID=2991925 RepID=A0ABW6IBT7_9CYAN
MYKVLAYITAYCDESAVKKCIAGIFKQTYAVNKIFVVDNSPKPLNILEPETGLVVIKSHPENIGISGGLVKAVDFGLQNNYDFLWMFDQDSIPTSDCLSQLVATFDSYTYTRNVRVGIVAPVPLDMRTEQVIMPAEFRNDHFKAFAKTSFDSPCFCDAPITSGSLLRLSATTTVAPPDSRLFIDGIDLDFGLRLRQKGFHNIFVPGAILHHNFATPVKFNFWGVKKILQRYSALRYYYICRNHTYLEFKNSQGFYKLTCIYRRLKVLLMKTLSILLVEPNKKFAKIWACFCGTYYGFRGNLDRQFDQSIKRALKK